MNPDEKLLAQYVALEADYKILDERREEMRKAIVEDFTKKNLEKVEHPELGLFTIGHRTSWKYSEAVVKLEEKVKLAKVKEQQKGVATSSDTSYLVFKAPKI